MATNREPPIGAIEGAPHGADETYDVYSVFALMPEVIESSYFRHLHYLALLSAFIGVPSSLIGVSKALRVPER
jgi:hypothetical protein